MPKPKTNPETKIASAALRLAARQEWKKLTLDQIAKAAKMPVAQVKKLFRDKDDLLPAIVRFVDRETLRSLGKPDPAATPHDRLFEIMMARIDVLQNHRRAVSGIMEEARRNPALLRRLLPAQIEAMKLMLKRARLEHKGLREAFSVAGLSGIYALTLCVWHSDTSSDLSKTMAVLDRNLRRASTVSEILFRALP